MSAYPAFAMSLLCILGGGIAFAKRGSMISLVAGVCTGLLYLSSAKQISEGLAVGYKGAFAASVLLAISSVPRIGKGPVPKALAVASSAMAFYYSRQLY